MTKIHEFECGYKIRVSLISNDMIEWFIVQGSIRDFIAQNVSFCW